MQPEYNHDTEDHNGEPLIEEVHTDSELLPGKALLKSLSHPVQPAIFPDIRLCCRCTTHQGGLHARCTAGRRRSVRRVHGQPRRSVHQGCKAGHMTMLQPTDSFAAVQFTINRVTVEDRHNTPEFEAAGYLWYLLASQSSAYLCGFCTCTRCSCCACAHLQATDSAPPCRNLLVFSRGKDRNPNALGIFLNAAGKDQPFGWQRRGVKFSLCVVNRLDFSKSVVKGEPASAQPGNKLKRASHQRQAVAGTALHQIRGWQPMRPVYVARAAVTPAQSMDSPTQPRSGSLCHHLPGQRLWPRPHACALPGDASDASCPPPGTKCSIARPVPP